METATAFFKVCDRPGIHVGLLPCSVKWQWWRKFGVRSLYSHSSDFFIRRGGEGGGGGARGSVYNSRKSVMDHAPCLQRNFLSLCSVLTQDLYWLNFILGKKTCFFFCFVKKKESSFSLDEGLTTSQWAGSVLHVPNYCCAFRHAYWTTYAYQTEK